MRRGVSRRRKSAKERKTAKRRASARLGGGALDYARLEAALSRVRNVDAARAARAMRDIRLTVARRRARGDDVQQADVEKLAYDLEQIAHRGAAPDRSNRRIERYLQTALYTFPYPPETDRETEYFDESGAESASDYEFDESGDEAGGR